MSAHRHPARHERGFSLVELMVSVVIGLLALTFATRLFVSSEQSKQASLGTSDSMQNGMQALFSISRDAAQAGWGLNDPLIAGCNTVFSDTDGFMLPSASRSDQGGAITPMAAVLIDANGAEPDSITLFAGSSLSGTGAVSLSKGYAGGSTLAVDRIAFAFRQGDVLLVVPDDGNGVTPRCAMAQLAAAPTLVDGVQEFSIISGPGLRFNRAGGLGENYGSSVTRVFNLGPAPTLSFHTWSLNNGFLQLRATNLAGASATAQTVVDNVVSLKAQYGFDTSPAFSPETGMTVGQWSAEMIDADNDTITGGPGDYQRIAAIRLVVVARSKSPQRPKANEACTATVARPVVFGDEQPRGVPPAPITVNVAVAGDPIDWKCYRYRAFETIVPMRNLAWRPTAQ